MNAATTKTPSKTQKVDRQALMRRSLTEEQAVVRDRFAKADKVLGDRPKGLAEPATPTVAPVTRSFSAETPVLPAATLSGRVLIKVALNRIHENPYNARFIYRQEKIRERAESLKKNGQMVAAKAVPHPTIPGDYIVIDGLYRKKGAVEANITEMELDVIPPMPNVEMYMMSWRINEERAGQTTLDNAFAWKKLIDDKVVDSEVEIANMLGMSKATINKTLALMDLPKSVVERMSTAPDKFGVSTGYEIAMLNKKLQEPELLALVDKVINEDLTSRQVAALRERTEGAGTPRRKKENSRQYKIRSGDVQIGSLKEWDNGRVAFEVSFTDPKERAALVTELRTRFGLNE